MENKKYLTEENYEKGKKKIKTIALVILVIGILIGGSLITTGVMKQAKVNSQYSEENKATISEQLETEKQNLINKKSEIEEKIEPIETEIKKLERERFTGFDDAYYERQDKIEELEKSIAIDKNSISVINDALFNHCFDNVKNNTYTSKYCSLKLQLDDFNDFNKEFDSFDSIPFYMFGTFIIIASCIISGSIYMVSKRREITAFGVQQMMPIAQEGIETIAPTVAKTGKEVIKEMAPAYGEVAKEISKGIKEGVKDEE